MKFVVGVVFNRKLCHVAKRFWPKVQDMVTVLRHRVYGLYYYGMCV